MNIIVSIIRPIGSMEEERARLEKEFADKREEERKQIQRELEEARARWALVKLDLLKEQEDFKNNFEGSPLSIYSYFLES